MQVERKPKLTRLSDQEWSLEEARGLLWVLKGMVPQESIALSTGIDQSQISRLLNGKFARVGGNAKKLCKYAKDLQQETSVGAVNTRQKLLTSALSLWDGSEDSASRVIALLDALKPIVRRVSQG